MVTGSRLLSAHILVSNAGFLQGVVCAGRVDGHDRQSARKEAPRGPNRAWLSFSRKHSLHSQSATLPYWRGSSWLTGWQR